MADHTRAHRVPTLLLLLVGGLVLVTGWVLSELGPPATASPVAVYGPCPAADSQTYVITITNAGGCTIGDKLFSNFGGDGGFVTPITSPEIGLALGNPLFNVP